MIGAKVNWWLDLYCRHLVSPSAIGIAISLGRYAKKENIQNMYNSYHRGVCEAQSDRIDPTVAALHGNRITFRKVPVSGRHRGNLLGYLWLPCV